MSYVLWQKLPERFLKMKYQRWCKLGKDVQRLIVDLANDQEFKCSLCPRDRDLVVEHDHEPQEGAGYSYTIYNIRGLVCSRCNWHLMLYEKEALGEGLNNWENANSFVSSSEYESYIYAYECRVGRFVEALLQKRIPNYWHRRLILDKFDDWYYEGGQPPLWYRRYKQKKSMKIETPEDFVRVVTAMVHFINEQFEKDPNYQPPDKLILAIGRIRQILQQVIAIREESSPAR